VSKFAYRCDVGRGGGRILEDICFARRGSEVRSRDRGNEYSGICAE